jgi:hypothetical protein
MSKEPKERLKTSTLAILPQLKVTLNDELSLMTISPNNQNDIFEIRVNSGKKLILRSFFSFDIDGSQDDDIRLQTDIAQLISRTYQDKKVYTIYNKTKDPVTNRYRANLIPSKALFDDENLHLYKSDVDTKNRQAGQVMTIIVEEYPNGTYKQIYP